MKKHFIGATYEVTQANMQNLVLQLDEANEKIRVLEKVLKRALEDIELNKNLKKFTFDLLEYVRKL